MPGRKFGHNSNYDESGMPLGTTTADYDNADEIRMNMVKSTYEEPLPLNDPEYQPKQLSKKFTGTDKAHGLPYGEKGFNSSVEDPEFPNYAVTETVDIEDPESRRQLLVREATAKGFDSVPELPKVEKPEVVDEVKKDIDDKEGDDFLKELEKQEPDKPEAIKEQEKQEEKKND